MIRTVEELNAKKAVCTANLETKINGTDGRRHIVLCGGTGCLSSHSDEIKARFEEVLKELNDPAVVNDQQRFRKLRIQLLCQPEMPGLK